MQRLEVSLIEWSADPHGGPRLLGRTDDPEAVAYIRDRLARERRAELARLAPPVRLVRPEDGPPEPEDPLDE